MKACPFDGSQRFRVLAYLALVACAQSASVEWEFVHKTSDDVWGDEGPSIRSLMYSVL